jgi:protein TonB
MQTLRYPIAVGWGGLITLALFYALWRVVSAPMEAPALKPTPLYRFTPSHTDTPVQPKERTKPEHKVPKVAPALPGIVGPTRTQVSVPLPRQRVAGPVIGGGGGVSIGSDQDVVPLVRVNPLYPQGPAARGVEGWVKVQFSITATGAVADLEVVDSSPKGAFEEATLDAVRRWRYSPKVVDGAAVERVGVQTVVTFRLSEK